MKINYKRMSLVIFSAGAVMINYLFLLACIGISNDFVSFMAEYLSPFETFICILFFFVAVFSFILAIFAIVAGYMRAMVIGISFYFLFANFPLVILGYDLLGLAGVINTFIGVLIALIAARREFFVRMSTIISMLLLLSYFLTAIWLTPRTNSFNTFLGVLLTVTIFQVFKVSPVFVAFGGVFAPIVLIAFMIISFEGIRMTHPKHSKVAHVMTLFALMFALLGLGFHALSGIPILSEFLIRNIGGSKELFWNFLMLLTLLCTLGSIITTALAWTMYEVTPPPKRRKKKRRIRKPEIPKKEIEKEEEELSELELELEEF